MWKKSCLTGLVFVTVLTTLLLWNEYHLTYKNIRRRLRRKGRGRKTKIGKVGKIPIIPGKPLASNNQYDQVKSFVLFIGYPRSGHTLVSTLIDAHPNAIIANEFDLIGKWQNWKPQNQNKYFLFDQMYKNSRMEAEEGYRSVKNDHILKYHIPGGYQGIFHDNLKVIGAKHGGKTTRLISSRHGSTVLKEIMKTVNIPFKFLHVVRNPYDNIATMLLRIKNMRLNMKPDFKINDTQALDKEIEKYFSLAKKNQRLIRQFGDNVHEVQSIEMIRRPRETLGNICRFLDLSCSQKYFHDCIKLVFTKPSRTRRNVVWTKEHKRKIDRFIKLYSFLKKFTFETD